MGRASAALGNPGAASWGWDTGIQLLSMPPELLEGREKSALIVF